MTMSETSNNESYAQTQDGLKKIREILVEMSKADLSKIHIGYELSWVPYVKEHVAFLVEQVDGLIENLKDSPPPQRPEELESIGKDPMITST